ncbi:RRNA-processing protein FCF1-like protein [Aphelenchoides bicaudatus]|nr:RRNA-processing protein FCF1-like protein [Aphelenchoides bicaudatus]
MNTWSNNFTRSIGATAVFETAAAVPPEAKSIKNFLVSNPLSCGILNTAIRSSGRAKVQPTKPKPENEQGRTKKTRKFRNVLQKRIKSTDSRIKEGDRVIRKKKEDDQELKITKVPRVSSALFLKYNSQLGKSAIPRYCRYQFC